MYQLRNILMAAMAATSVHVAAQTDTLRAGFVSPPQSARPRVWWHWMNGNISRDGIYKDLTWMNRVGIGGVHIFDAGKNTPQVVPHRIVYMTPEWKDCYRYAVQLADSLGMEATMTGTPGWSNTGGPWVTPADAMKKLVWRQVTVRGGRVVDCQLPAPYSVSGAFQNVAARGTVSKQQLYGDIAVLAVRVAPGDLTLSDMGARVTASGGKFTVDMLTDGDMATTANLTPDSAGRPAWLQVELARPYTIRALSLKDGRQHSQWRNKRPAPTKWLEASSDGVHFTKVCDLVLGGAPLATVDIPPTTARFFRVVFRADKRPLAIAELNLYTTYRVNHSEEKAAFGTPVDLPLYPTPATDTATPLAQVVDLTGMVSADGHLRWKAPAGRWRIYRFGYSLTGKMNHPASPEATGLEVDKMSAPAVARYIGTYLSTYVDATKGMMGRRGLQNLLIDSYEAGIANWTPTMLTDFARLRGYDMLRWMPALAGEIIESSAKTDRFLFDWRHTLGELVEENLYHQVADTMAARGMGTYFESHESCRVYEADGMAVKRHATVPMGAMWASEPVMHFNDRGETGKQGDIRESASVAHIYGQNLVAAESLTSNGLDGDGLAYSLTPNLLKPAADLEFASGVNRIVIHDSAHQPVDDKIPGQGLEIYGQWFHRHETWAEQARPWVDYLARTSYMLQQGHFVADVAYYYGDDNNVTGLFYAEQPKVPATVAYDYVNTPALTSQLAYANGRIVTPSGMTYRMLALDANTARMTVPALRRIAALVDQGMPLCGARPTMTPSLSDDEAEFAQLVSRIWDGNHPHVFEHATIGQALAAIGVAPDFSADTMDSLRYVHRTLPGTEIYWINNRSYHQRTVNATFRVAGLTPYRWNPETGSISRLAYQAADKTTTLSLSMEPGEACFVVFRAQPDEAAAPALAADSAATLLTLSAPWAVSFQPGRGAPAQMVMPQLASLSESADEGIRYFAGMATYRQTFRLSRADMRAGRLWIDLGRVCPLAEVVVNGHNLGILWRAPFTVDATTALHRGDNTIEVRVSTLWRNRIIGDRQPSCKHPYTYTSYPFYKADSKLQPSGLLGPVSVRGEKVKKGFER